MNRLIIVILIIGKLMTFVFSDKEQQLDNIKLILENDEFDVRNNSDTATVTAAAASPETLECPSTNIIRIKYKCRGTSNLWTDCLRSQCCPGYNLINGECIPRNINPCSLNLCEQQCSFIFQRIVCTCWDGFRFTADNGKRSNQSMCIDIDECKEGTHDCQQICENTNGSFVCSCTNGFILRNDNKTCKPITNISDNDNERCLANCHTVEQMQKKISRLQEKLAALEIATSLLVHDAAQYPTRHGPTCPPGPPGPPGSPGEPGWRVDHSPGDLHHTSTAYTDEVTRNNPHLILDSFIQTNVGYCKCQRGPIGPQGPAGTPGRKGAAGERGPRGSKGATGNLDFFLLILADIRHDITLLQERISPGETLSKFDFEAVLKKQRSIVDTKTDENNQSDEMQNFQESETLRMSNYKTQKDKFFESSGDEWDHYD